MDLLLLIDSSEPIETCYTTLGWFELKITVGDILTLIGIIFAVWQFRYATEESRKQALCNQKENWFLNVIVLPQLETINEFYLKLLEFINDDRSNIELYKTHSFDECTLRVAELKQKRKQVINNCFDHIIALVMSYDETLGKEVNDIIMSLEDKYVEIIDCFVQNQYVDNIREIVLQNKQELIAKLNSGMKK